jgi:hypothetical protein
MYTEIVWASEQATTLQYRICADALGHIGCLVVVRSITADSLGCMAYAVPMLGRE